MTRINNLQPVNLRADVLAFLEFIITETGMSTDPEQLASVICAKAVELRDALEANVADPHMTPPRCTCWIGRGDSGGWAPDRITCAIHSDASLALKSIDDLGALAALYARAGASRGITFEDLQRFVREDDAHRSDRTVGRGGTP